jgi:hypothetical protein
MATARTLMVPRPIRARQVLGLLGKAALVVTACVLATLGLLRVGRP